MQDGEFLFGALRLVVAQQCQHQAVTVRDGVAEFLFTQGGVEVGDRFLRHLLGGDQPRAYQLEIQAVRHEMVGDLLHAIIDIGDTFVRDRVGAQIGGRIAFQQLRGLLHALEKGRHGARIEAGFFQDAEADAVGFLFMLAREVELVLHRAGLCADDSGGCGLRAVACGQDGHGQRCQCGERVVARARDHARIVMLGDVRDFVAQHRGEFRFALCQQDQSGVDADETAGQGEGVDGVVVDGEELERLSRFRAVCHQPSAELVEIVGNLGVVHVAVAGANLEHALFADLPFHLRRNQFLRYITQIRQSVCKRKQWQRKCC